jgi:signal transduction histidine kinase
MEGRILAKDNKIKWQLEPYMDYFVLGEVEKNSEYKALSFDQSVPIEIQEDIRGCLQRDIGKAAKVLGTDENFGYLITDTVTDISRGNDNFEQINNKKSSINKNYKLSSQLDIYTWLDKHYTIKNRFIENGKIDEWGDPDGEYISYIKVQGVEVNLKHIKLHKPKDISIRYNIPRVLTDNDGIIYEQAIAANMFNYTYFSTIAMGALLLILGLLVVLYNRHKVEIIKPFKIFIHMKIEVALILITIAMFLSVIAINTVPIATLNGDMIKYINKMGISLGNSIIFIINFITWIYICLSISIAWFYLKYVVCSLDTYFIKEKSLLYIGISKVVTIIKRMMVIDFTNKIYRTIQIVIVINTALMLFFTTLSISMLVIIIICFIGLITLIGACNKTKKIQNEYDALLQETKQLGEGNLNQEVKEDFVVFEQLYEDFLKIQTGFKKAVEEETKSQNMKTELISNVSHDLKTPLTCIKNYIELLQSPTISETERNEYIKNINLYSQRLTRLIEDLFEVSKVNSEDIQLEFNDLQIVSLIEQVQTEHLESLQTKNLQVVMNITDKNIILSLDSNKTYRIFENLFTNITKYALPHTRVYIDILDTEDTCEIQIKNISESQMNFQAEEIVERFVRGDTSRHEQGSGLGLAIVQSFMEIQHGKSEVVIDGDLFKVILIFYKNNK